MENKTLIISGKKYRFLGRTFSENEKGEKTQTEGYETITETGVERAYLTCIVPQNYEYVATESLSDKCLKKMLESDAAVRIDE